MTGHPRHQRARPRLVFASLLTLAVLLAALPAERARAQAPDAEADTTIVRLSEEAVRRSKPIVRG